MLSADLAKTRRTKKPTRPSLISTVDQRRRQVETVDLCRAASEATEPEKRAEAYVVLASKDWDCSFKITELPTNKITTIDPTNNKATVSYKKPKDQKISIRPRCA